MKKILTYFFVTLGIIFFLLILAATYFYIADPLNLKPLFFGTTSEETTYSPEASAETDTNQATQQETQVDTASPAVSPEQQSALQAAGIDPASLPTEITPQQEACFVDVLGEARVAEIREGALPTAAEIFRARGCIE